MRGRTDEGSAYSHRARALVARTRGRTLSAEMMCSGAIVFFDSCSHISFASEDTRCMNSAKR